MASPTPRSDCCLRPRGRGPRIDQVRREPFSGTGRVEPAADDAAGALCYVSCGRPLPGHAVRIEGRLEFRGPSVTGGYYRNPEQTRRLFDGDWLGSGDRAYLADGEVLFHGPRLLGRYERNGALIEVALKTAA